MAGGGEVQLGDDAWQVGDLAPGVAAVGRAQDRARVGGVLGGERRGRVERLDLPGRGGCGQ